MFYQNESLNTDYFEYLDLKLGIEHIYTLARNELKRELIKSERETLLKHYVDAVNASNSVYLRKRYIDLRIIGNVWHNLDGSIPKFLDLIKTVTKFELTKKEIKSLKDQFKEITKRDRFKVYDQACYSRKSPIQLKAAVLGDTATGKTKGTNLEKSRILSKDIQKIMRNKKERLQSEYAMKTKAAKVGKEYKVKYTHAEYNSDIKQLKRELDFQREYKEKVGNKTIDQIQNKSSGRTIWNAAGYAPVDNSKKRYSRDGYNIDSSSEPTISGTLFNNRVDTKHDHCANTTTALNTVKNSNLFSDTKMRKIERLVRQKTKLLAAQQGWLDLVHEQVAEHIANMK